jgi:hypothetical protein
VTIPDWLLERSALGELPEHARAAVEADPDLQAQLDALSVSDVEVRQSYDAFQVASRAHRRATPIPRRRWWALGPLLATAAAAGLVYVTLPRPDGHRAKGSPHPVLIVHQQVKGGVRELSDGDTVRPGDVLQLEVVAAGSRHGWVLSIDGNQSVTLHNEGTLEAGQSLLPQGYQLDDAPYFEHFWLVVTDEPLPRAQVQHAVQQAPAQVDGRGIALDLPHAVEVDVWLRKP